MSWISVEWLWNWRIEHCAIYSSACSFTKKNDDDDDDDDDDNDDDGGGVSFKDIYDIEKSTF